MTHTHTLIRWSMTGRHVGSQGPRRSIPDRRSELHSYVHTASTLVFPNMPAGLLSMTRSCLPERSRPFCLEFACVRGSPLAAPLPPPPAVRRLIGDSESLRYRRCELPACTLVCLHMSTSWWEGDESGNWSSSRCGVSRDKQQTPWPCAE